MANLSRKHFEQLAKAIGGNITERDVLAAVVVDVTAVLQDTNPQFDAVKFAQAASEANHAAMRVHRMMQRRG